jgi:hypothetical protein
MSRGISPILVGSRTEFDDALKAINRHLRTSRRCEWKVLRLPSVRATLVVVNRSQAPSIWAA